MSRFSPSGISLGLGVASNGGHAAPGLYTHHAILARSGTTSAPHARAGGTTLGKYFPRVPSAPHARAGGTHLRKYFLKFLRCAPRARGRNLYATRGAIGMTSAPLRSLSR